jgi:hypothetical protein
MQKTLRLKWLSLVLGAAAAMVFLELARKYINTNLDEAAFGRDTRNVLIKVDGLQVSCMYASDSNECVSSYEKSGQPPSILWLGNSQLAAINRYKPGDSTASTILHRKLSERGYYVVTYSEPNANLFEHGVVLSALEPIYKPRLVILPLFLDKIREQGIRPAVAAFLDAPNARTRIEASSLWPLVAPLLTPAKSEGVTETPELPFSVKFEAELNAKLGQYSALWRDRPELKGQMNVGLFRLRNRILGINAQTKRKVDLAVYREKMNALEAILKDARAHNVRVLLYIPPYRQDIDGPNVQADYDMLKRDSEALAQKYGSGFANLDNIVPGPEWATVVDTVFGVEDYDFVHFTADGHRRHAEALDTVLRGMGF